MSRLNERGFTLLELLVATVIMAVAVGGLLNGLQNTVESSARANRAGEVPAVAQRVMDHLLAEADLPNFRDLHGNEGVFEWVAHTEPFEYPARPQVGSLALQRVRLQIGWLVDAKRHRYEIDGFRQSVLTAADALRLSVSAAASP